MAAFSIKAIQVNCCAQRPSSVNAFDQFKNQLLSSFQPFVDDLQKLPKKLLAPHAIIKKTSLELLNSFTDSVFQFNDIDQSLPSQSNFGPVEEVGDAINIDDVQGIIPGDFPEGVYIRNVYKVVCEDDFDPTGYYDDYMSSGLNTGPNPLFGGFKSTKSVFGRSSHVWVEGEGMLHALYFKKQSDGKWSVSYNNKHVETETLKIEKQRNTPSFLPAAEGDSPAIISAYLLNFMRFGTVNKLLSNTSVFEHSGKFYAAAENHLPQEIDIRTLDTLGNWDVNRSWNRPFTSHPKKAPGSGELVMMGVNAVKPFFEIGIISEDGIKLVHKADLKFKRCSLTHDIGVTMRYNVILDFPLTIDIKRLINGGPLIKYNKMEHARIGVMPRYGDGDSVRWFQVQPCCVFHIINTYEDGDEVILWAFRARDSIIPGPDFGLNKFEWFSTRFKTKHDTDVDSDESFFSRAYEWRLNMKTGEVNEQFLTGKSDSMDFPMINENFTGFRNKYGYAQIVDLDASSFSSIPKYGGLVKLHLTDRKQEDNYVKMEYHKFPKNTFCSGATFVAKPGGTEEDDGWVITFVHDERLNISRLEALITECKLSPFQMVRSSFTKGSNVLNEVEAIIVDAKKFTSEPVAVITLPSRVPYGFHGAFMSLNL